MCVGVHACCAQKVVLGVHITLPCVLHACSTLHVDGKKNVLSLQAVPLILLVGACFVLM